MPLTPAVTAPLFTANMLANLMLGVATPKLAYGIATGLEIYAGGGLQIQSVDVGVLGAGVGAGVGLLIVPQILIASFTASFGANGLLGPMSPLMISALALSFAQAFAQAEIVTASPLVGVGAGVVTAIPNSSASAAAFQAGLAAADVKGPMSQKLVSALSQGLDAALPSGVGAVVIAGSPSIVPSAGSGVGTLV